MNDKHPFILVESQRSLFNHFRWKLLNFLAVKALKTIFENVKEQLPLLDISVKCKSVSVLTGTPSFYCKQI